MRLCEHSLSHSVANWPRYLKEERYIKNNDVKSYIVVHIDLFYAVFNAFASEVTVIKLLKML